MKFEKVKIYVLSDSNFDHLNYFRQAIKAKVDAIQLRDKELSDREFYQIALKIKRLIKKRDILFIINDRVEIAKLVDADGVHLGEDDLAPSLARKLLGKKKIIGYSVHNLREALFALKEGCDYISIGPLFKSKSKPHLIPLEPKEVKLIMNRILLPKVAIGGINLDNIYKIKSLGFKRIAIINSFSTAEDKIELIKKMKMILKDEFN